jgi:hypothetical protein
MHRSIVVKRRPITQKVAAKSIATFVRRATHGSLDVPKDVLANLQKINDALHPTASA